MAAANPVPLTRPSRFLPRWLAPLPPETAPKPPRRPPWRPPTIVIGKPLPQRDNKFPTLAPVRTQDADYIGVTGLQAARQLLPLFPIDQTVLAGLCLLSVARRDRSNAS